MNMHDGESAVVLRYVQGELEGQELTEFSLHLKTCRECKARVEEEMALSELFRKTNPLYRAPDALRDRVTAMVNQAALNSSTRIATLELCRTDSPRKSLAMGHLAVVLAGRRYACPYCGHYRLARPFSRVWLRKTTSMPR